MEEIIELVHAEIINSGYDGKLAGGLVLTGGGAQLNSLQQLVEYMTGMDVRIGYPNEHLGKSTTELKSPMYATAIGLVLSGFMSLDERQNQYNELRPVKEKKEHNFGRFFRDILERSKTMLVDDLDGNDSY